MNGCQSLPVRSCTSTRVCTYRNCRRIEECNEVYMRLVSGGLTVDIRGNGLRAYDFSTGGLVIRGCIEQIGLTERRSRRENETTSESKRQGEKAV